MKIIFKIKYDNFVTPTAVIITNKLEFRVDEDGYYTNEDISASWIENKSLRHIYKYCPYRK